MVLLFQERYLWSIAEKIWIIRISPTWRGMRTPAVPHSLSLNSAAGGGTRRQTSLSVSEFLASATGEQHQGVRRAGIVGCLFLDTCFGQAKEVCQAASKGNLMDNWLMIQH